MNRAITVLFTVTLLALSVVDAFSQIKPGSTQWLYNKCKSSDPAQQESCAAYLIGSAEVMAMMGKTYRSPPDGIEKETVAALGIVGICSQSGNGAVLRQVFINWAEKNPTDWQLGAVQGVMTAFQETWPCHSP